MKTFNLEKALAGEPVIMQDGTPVKIAGYNPDAKHSQCVLFWDANGTGRGATELGKVGYVDMLFMAPTERKEWVVRCQTGCLIGPFETLQEAEFYVTDANKASIHQIIIHD
jgi:hypothetical protein